MIIKVDQEGKEAIELFADAVLKGTGLRARNKVNEVMDNIELIEETKEELQEGE